MIDPAAAETLRRRQLEPFETGVRLAPLPYSVHDVAIGSSCYERRDGDYLRGGVVVGIEGEGDQETGEVTTRFRTLTISSKGLLLRYTLDAATIDEGLIIPRDDKACRQVYRHLAGTIARRIKPNDLVDHGYARLVYLLTSALCGGDVEPIEATEEGEAGAA